MDDNLIKLHIFLDSCYEIECCCAEMYYFFAEQFADNRKLSRLWSKTAMEEENHARHVLLAKKMVSSINWVCLESWRNATTALALVKQTIRSIRESPPGQKDAILMALACEHRLENLHMQSAILVKEAVGNSMFKALLKADRQHVELLEATLDMMQREEAGVFEIIDFEVMPTQEIMDYDLSSPVRCDPALPAPWQSILPEKTASG